MTARPERVLLTGATGFLGGAVLAHASQTDDLARLRWTLLVRAEGPAQARARVLHRLERFVGSRAAPFLSTCDVICADLADPDSLARADLSGVTHALHLGACTSFRARRGVWEVNYQGTLDLARRLARGPALQRLLHVSTAMGCGAAPPQLLREDDLADRGDGPHFIPYTASKAAAEQALRAMGDDLPLVIARPSIVVGHTRLGCRPSGSIFWALRTYDHLGFVTCDPGCRLDVVPADWAAEALLRLLFKPTLQHRCYHVSAGAQAQVSAQGIHAALCQVRGQHITPLVQRDRAALAEERERLLAVFGKAGLRFGRIALELYMDFLSLDVTFDNTRLLAEGVPPPPRFTSYLSRCLADPPGISIAAQALED